MFSQNRQEESFPFRTMWQETINRKIFSNQVTRNAPIGFNRYRQYIRTQFLGYPRDIVLILFPIESTSTVYQNATRFQCRPYVRKNPTLTLPTDIHILHTPFVYSHLVFSEHAFTRTRYIRKNHIKQMCQFRKISRIIVGYHYIRMSPLDEILGQHLRTVTHHLIGYQQASFWQSRSA